MKKVLDVIINTHTCNPTHCHTTRPASRRTY